MSYNGWKNYETFSVNVWATNHGPTYQLIIGHLWKFTPSDARNLMYQMFPEGTPDFDHCDDYDKVDWNEICDSFNEIRDGAN